MVLIGETGAAPVERDIVYPGARLVCPGPERTLDAPFVAILGERGASDGPPGRSLAQVLEASIGMACVDFSAAHAGPDAYLADTGLAVAMQRARAVVLAVPGAHGLRNPFYTVHRWSNDRVIGQSQKLRALFPELDFFGYSYVRHMLGDMQACCPERFAAVRDTLRGIWMERMEDLIDMFDAPVICVLPEEVAREDEQVDRLDGVSPLVTRDMFDGLTANARVVMQTPRKRFGRARQWEDEVKGALAPAVEDLLGQTLGRGGKGPRTGEAPQCAGVRPFR